MMMHCPTTFDLWLTTDPREAEAAAWEQFSDRYADTASRLLVDHLTETLPPALTPRDRAALVARVRALVDGLDGETVLTWAHEVTPDAVPAFETWAHPERAA
jgi:hypothetical protein